ncbi:MAG TPA: ATP-binding protein [Polyangia bacterium]
MRLLQAHEPARLTALAECRIVGSEREGAFDELVAIARKRFEAPIAAVSFVDERRWWPKAISGFARCSLPRQVTFCHFAIAEGDGDDLFVVDDTHRDDRFAGSPLVAGGPRVRFYAGVPLRDSLGYALGTFSILDVMPRSFGLRDAESLREFGRLAVQLVELRRAARRADLDRAELIRVTRSLALLEALLSTVADAADVSTALWSTAQRIGELTGWSVRSVWRPGAPLESPLPAQASIERRALADGDGGAAAIPVLAGDEVFAVLSFDLANAGDTTARDPSLLAAVAGVVQPLGALVRRRRIEEQLRASEVKLRSVTESARDGIVTLARDGTIVYANPAARVMFGRDEMRGLAMQKLISGFGLDAKGGVPMERWAAHASGRRFPVELSIAEWTIDKSGYVTSIVRDVSERFEAQADAEAAQRRLAFLFRATSELLEQPLSTDALLATVARLVLPQLGDYCIVDLAEGDRHLRRVGSVPEHETLTHTLDATAAFAAAGDSLVTRVLRTGQPFVFSPSEPNSASTPLDLAISHVWAHASWRACLVVPLLARNRTVGAITLVSFGRAYSRDDLALAQELGHRVALAVDNAHLYDEARAAVRVRDDVLAIVSHDLRNPLSTILTSTGRLLETVEGDGVRAPLERCQRAARRMTHMISDLVDAASLETGTLSLDQRDNEVSRVVSDALDLLQPLADARGLEMSIELVPGIERAFCDRERIVQVLSNIVGNAIKFTPRGGHIRISADHWGDMVRVAVTDDGPGIAPDQMPRIFDRYWHLAQRESRHGAGLGLYIAKGIIENHGGRIWVESTLGCGSTFFFTLPAINVVEAHASN